GLLPGHLDGRPGLLLEGGGILRGLSLRALRRSTHGLSGLLGLALGAKHHASLKSGAGRATGLVSILPSLWRRASPPSARRRGAGDGRGRMRTMDVTLRT